MIFHIKLLNFEKLKESVNTFVIACHLLTFVCQDNDSQESDSYILKHFLFSVFLGLTF